MVAMRKQAAWALGLSSFLGWAVVACSSFSVSDAPDAQASLPDAADDRTVPVGQDASTEDAGPSDAPLPGAKCSVRTVSTVPGVQRVQRYLDKLYFSGARPGVC